MDNGYKLIGSAQLYRERCILQHGSMRLLPDPSLVENVFGTPIMPPQDLMMISAASVVDALAAAAQRIFDIRFEVQPLSHREQQHAVAWAQAKSSAQSISRETN